MTITPRPPSEVATCSSNTYLVALEAAATAARLAAEKGLPEPLRIGATADGVEVSLFMPDFLRWLELLTHRKVSTDHAGYLSVVGTAGGQEWTLRPVHEPCPVWDEDGVLRVCDRCAELPDTFRQPLSPEAWRDQRWFELIGRHWSEPAPSGVQ